MTVCTREECQTTAGCKCGDSYSTAARSWGYEQGYQAGIREERERCAKMVENYTIEAGQSRPSRQELAAAIRKQGE